MEQTPVIRELPLATVHRIAAGEVIEKPSCALKELLENSLDAKATEIEILFAGDGFQIRDNGHGIRFEDLPVLCRRHTTSKIRTFEDLKEIETLGFRGEALCSVSYVSCVTVTTRTATSPCGFRAVYVNGEMHDIPVPSAALGGTTVSVRDLFARDPLRPKEETMRYLDIIHGYAVHSYGVGFIVKREEKRTPELRIRRDESRLDRISRIFGCEAGRNGQWMEATFTYPEQSVSNSNPSVLSLDGWIGSADRQKRMQSVFLFINGRCVTCAPLKRAIQALYTTLLPKRMPVVYLSIRMPHSCVDVNVHPTKREIEFLWKDDVIQKIISRLQAQLKSFAPVRAAKFVSLECPSLPSLVPLHEARIPEHLVHEEGRRVIAEHQYVGMTGERYVFVHSENVVYMMDICILARDFFCQTLKRPVHCKRLEPPLALSHAVQEALKKMSPVGEEGSTVRCERNAADLTGILMRWRKPLQEMFLLDISESRVLFSVPLPLASYPLNLQKIPHLLVTLAERLSSVETESSISHLAEVFAQMFSVTDLLAESSFEDVSSLVEDVLLPVMRMDYFPSPARMTDGSIVQLSTIGQLCSKCGR